MTSSSSRAAMMTEMMKVKEGEEEGEGEVVRVEGALKKDESAPGDNWT